MGFTLHGVRNHVLGLVWTLDHHVRISVSRCKEELTPWSSCLQKHLSSTDDPPHLLDFPEPLLPYRNELHDALRRFG